MAAPNRVEELRKRYHENPKKFFAPFANELRKTGQVDRAILICQKHLGEQPASMNGFVVYGQCLFELGQLDEARGPFESALALDPENLIALRHLGDIARLGGDTETARSWYTRLLEFDRRNDEVIALLEEVGGRQDVEPASGPSRAPNIISVAPSVRVTASSQAVGLTGDAPPMPPRGSTPIRPMTPPPAEAPAAVSRPPALEDAKTVEVVIPPKPAKRASLFDVSFDFGEGSSAPTPAPAAKPAPRTPTPAFVAAPPVVPPAAPPAASVGETTEPLMPRFRPPTPAMPEFVVPTAAAPSVPPADELPPAVEGIELAEFSAEVAPLPDLETSEFESVDVARLDDFESESASAPSVQPLALEGMEEREFRPPANSGAFRSILEPVDDALPTIEGVDGLIDADLDPMGASLESMSAPSELIETTDSEFFVAGLDELSSTPELEPNGPGVEAFHTDGAIDDFGPLADADHDAAIADVALPSLPAEPDDPASIAIDETFEIEPPSVGVGAMFEAEPASAAAPVTFVTETMAKVYLEQGLTDRAIDVYRQLVAQSPADEGLRDRLRALETQSRASLEFEVPADAVEIAEPAPANAMLSAMSFDEVALDTPVAARPPRVTPAAPVSPVSAVAEPSGPNVRDFFAAFARRGLTVAPPVVTIPTAAGSPLSPLDELFGPEVNVEDERAAHRLAAVGATSGPSGGTALDSLFGEGPSAPMPPELPSATPGSPRVSRASEKLRFDQFFSSSSVPSAMSTPTDADSAPIVESSSYTGDLPSAAPDDDDLDQFQGWLRGLTK